MAAAIARMYAELDMKNRGFLKGADEVEQRTGRLQKALGATTKVVAGLAKAAVGATAAAAAGGVLTFKGLIEPASDLAETISKTNAVFGSNAEAMLKWGETAATSVGLSKQAALEAASTVGNLLKGVGVANKDLPVMSENIIQAAADLGSFNNVDPAQVVEDLRSALVGEAEPVRKYGILLNEAAVKAKALELGLVGANGELSEGAKIQARYALIMEQLGDAQGDFAKTSGGLANGTRILKANFTDLRAELGMKLLPIVTRFVAGVNRWFKAFNNLRTLGVDPLSAAFMAFRQVVTTGDDPTGLSRFSEKVEHVIRLLIAFAPIAWKYFIRTLEVIGKVLGFVIDHLDLIAPIVVGLTTSFLLFYKVVPAIKAARVAIIALRVSLLALNPWLLVLTAAVALFALAYTKNWFGIRDITKKVIDFVIRAFTRFVAIVRGGKGLGKALEGLPKPIQKLAILLRRVIAIGQKFFQAWKSGGPIAAFRQLSHDVEKIGRTLGNFFASIGLERFGAEIKNTFRLVGQLIREVVSFVDNVIHGRWGKAWQDFKDIAVIAVKLFIQRFVLLGALLLDVFELIPWTDIGNALWNGAKGAFTKLWDGLVAVWRDTIRPWLGERITAITKAILSRTIELYNAGRTILSWVWTGIASLAQWFIDQVYQIPNGIWQVFQNFGMWFYNIGRNIVSGIWTGIASLGGWLWDQIQNFVLSQITGAFNWALNSNSPSKVMMAIGGDVGKGMAIGILKEAKTVESASRRLAGVAVGASSAQATPSLASQAVTPRAVATAANQGSAGGTRIVNIKFEDGAIKSNDPEGVAREIMKRIRYIEAGVA